MSLRRKRDASGICDLPLLQVLHQLGQPTLGGGVVLQDLGKSGVFELIGEALPQSFSGSAKGPNTRSGVRLLSAFFLLDYHLTLPTLHWFI